MRACSEGATGAGGTTAELSFGAEREFSAETLGAGGTTELRVSLLRECAALTSTGAGAITFAARAGAVSEECKPSAEGAAGTAGKAGLDLRARRFATFSAEEGSLRLGASTTFPVSALPRAMRMV